MFSYTLKQWFPTWGTWEISSGTPVLNGQIYWTCKCLLLHIFIFLSGGTLSKKVRNHYSKIFQAKRIWKLLKNLKNILLCDEVLLWISILFRNLTSIRFSFQLLFPQKWRNCHSLSKWMQKCNRKKTSTSSSSETSRWSTFWLKGSSIIDVTVQWPSVRGVT